MTAVRLEKIAKHFGKTVALSNIDLEINAGGHGGPAQRQRLAAITEFCVRKLEAAR